MRACQRISQNICFFRTYRVGATENSNLIDLEKVKSGQKQIQRMDNGPPSWDPKLPVDARHPKPKDGPTEGHLPGWTMNVI